MSNNQNSRAIALDILKRVEVDDAYVDILLRGLPDALPVKERAFVSELVRGTIRWKKRLDWITGRLLNQPDQKLPHDVRLILWLGLYQIIYTRVPPFAAVNESVRLAGRVAKGRYSGLVNAVLRNYIRRPHDIKFPDPKLDPVAALGVEKSFPKWMIQRWLSLWGLKFTTELCDALNATPKLSFRVNRSKISVKDFEEILFKKNISFKRTVLPFYYVSDVMPYTKQTEFLEQGLMTVQDTSAGFPGILADPQTGQVIADVCAAPGGKSLHLAELSENRAIILSADLRPSRVGMIKTAQVKTGARLHPLVADARFFPGAEFDTVMLDVPCSGLGVLRKKTDMRWKRKPEDVKQLSGLQLDLLCTAATLVRKGGCIVYSTCTIDPQENEQVVDQFMRRFPFKVDPAISIAESFRTDSGMVRTWPQLHDMDGSFAVKLIYR
ncbi:16S rRNA (cytosine(967)-C(5))-methyltransferase RsmB [candidate division KSB1 bacterium]|nr:16S rRNA (cytosine(967)-C(5))-methyltransferase RsmB [candidate division KSB1 bacterium]